MAGVVDNKGLSSIGITVKVKAKELNYVTSIPELGAAPTPLDTTTLKDKTTTSIPGVQELKDFEFGLLYDNKTATSDFRMLKGLEEAGEVVPVEIKFPDGTTFSYDAYISVRPNSTKVNELLGATMTTSPQTAIVTKNPTVTP